MRAFHAVLLPAALASAFVGPLPISLRASRRNEAAALHAKSRRDLLSDTVTTGLACSSSLLFPSLQQTNAAAAVLPTASTSISLPPMGLGAWAWGDSLFWGYSPKEDEELRRVFDYAVASSKTQKTLFDTAELYGLGRSESLLGKFSRDCAADRVQIATKFAPVPFLRDAATDVAKACEASVKRLGGRPIDLYQVHFPSARHNADFWDGLAAAHEKGLVKNVGVSNYGSDAIRACHEALAARNLPLATNQIQYSLLYTWPEMNGLLETCRELDVKVLAYSPLALGFLTGKYNKDVLPSGPRSKIGKELFSTPDFANLLGVMQKVADSNPDATLSQVAINWTRAKGTIPIPGARTISQVKQNYGALEWDLTSSQVKELDEAASKVTTFLGPDASPFFKEDTDTHLKMFDS